MHYEPHSYQEAATNFICKHAEAAIFLECGLGKTAITLAAVKYLMHDAFEVSKTLVIAPLRVAKMTWTDELQKWDSFSDLSCAVAVGNPAIREAALLSRADITCINREMVSWLVKFWGKRWPYDMVVIDELSSFKNHKAERFRALMSVRPYVKRIVGLTGTPASNGLMDLFAEFRLLDEGKRLGRYITHYRERYFVPDARSATQVFSYKPRAGAEDAIYQKIGDMTLSMRTADYLKLPPITSCVREVVLNAKARKTYEQMVRDMVATVDTETIDAASAAALSGKLLQMATGAVYAEDGSTHELHTAKLDALEDIIEAANGKSLLVATWFQSDTARICARFPEARALKCEADIRAWN